MRWLIVFAAVRLLAQDELAQHAVAAAAAMRAGDYASAEQHNRAIVRLAPQMAEAQVNLGLSCFMEKKYTDAIRAFETGLKLNPALVNARLFLGMSEFNLNQAASAITTLRRYISERPEDPQGQYYLGVSYLALDRVRDAEAVLAKAHQLAPRDIDVLYHLAQAYVGEARQPGANHAVLGRSYEDAVNQIAAIDPGSYRLAQLRAGYYERQGKPAQAVDELNRLLGHHDPRAQGIHYTLGCLYTEQRQYEKALAEFREELKLDAPYPRTYLQLAHVYVATERPQQALPLLEHTLKSDPPSSALAWVEFGKAYRLLNQPAKSVEAFEKAISLGERNSSTYYQLGMAARKAGDMATSRDAFATSQKLRKTTPASLETN